MPPTVGAQRSAGVALLCSHPALRGTGSRRGVGFFPGCGVKPGGCSAREEAPATSSFETVSAVDPRSAQLSHRSTEATAARLLTPVSARPCAPRHPCSQAKGGTRPDSPPKTRVLFKNKVQEGKYLTRSGKSLILPFTPQGPPSRLGENQILAASWALGFWYQISVRVTSSFLVPLSDLTRTLPFSEPVLPGRAASEG